LLYGDIQFALVDKAESIFIKDFGDRNVDDFQLVKPHLSLTRNRLVELGLGIRKETRVKMTVALIMCLLTTVRRKHAQKDVTT
jgi:hypothetical protein